MAFFRHPSHWVLQQWREQSSQDREIATALAPVVGTYLREQRLFISLREQRLLLHCADRGCATELRFMQRDLRKILEAHGYTELQDIKVLLVLPSGQPPIPEPLPQRAPLSAATSAVLLSAANQIQHSPLAEALRRLARQCPAQEAQHP